jgi:methylenetetrahydrofolate dehydrogenase (NADP+)/methenyltetrahydrofolate cyclohydrolase
MAAEILDGKTIARRIQDEISQQVSRHLNEFGDPPRLAALLVGDDPASQVYVSNKEKACRRVGIESRLHTLPANATTDDVLASVRQLNADEAVHGILVQLPLPPQVNSSVVLDAVDPLKDVDAFHPYNVGLISQGRPRFLPCTPHGILQLLARYRVESAGRHVVIVGRSDIVGKPMAMLFAARDIGLGPELANATVTICHSHTTDLPQFTRTADILIAAIGRPKFITGTMIKPGSVVVDVGINRTSEGLVGDVDFASAAKVARYLTPVPGGVGPLTVTMLLQNTLSAARLQGSAACRT